MPNPKGVNQYSKGGGKKAGPPKMSDWRAKAGVESKAQVKAQQKNASAKAGAERQAKSLKKQGMTDFSKGGALIKSKKK